MCIRDRLFGLLFGCDGEGRKHRLQIHVDWSIFHFQFFHQKIIKFEGSEAWKYQNGVQLDVPNSLVYSKVEKVIKTQQ